jgi:hypothetical protein
MKTFKQYLKDKKLEESIQGNIALGLGAAGALMGLGGGSAHAQNPDQKKLASITKKIDQETSNIADAENIIKKLQDGQYDKILMKTNLEDEEKNIVNWIEEYIKDNPSLAYNLLKKEKKDFSFYYMHKDQKEIANRPVVKLIFKIFPAFKKALEKGGNNWLEIEGLNALPDLMRHQQNVFDFSNTIRNIVNP